MRPKLLIDMNLSPDWVDSLSREGWEAVHWSEVGEPRATDREVMDWAVANAYVVLTHDLDFGTMLALTQDRGPSVLQVRAENVTPPQLGPTVIAALEQHQADLSAGALVVVDERRSRVRVLPI